MWSSFRPFDRLRAGGGRMRILLREPRSLRRCQPDQVPRVLSQSRHLFVADTPGGFLTIAAYAEKCQARGVRSEGSREKRPTLGFVDFRPWTFGALGSVIMESQR